MHANHKGALRFTNHNHRVPGCRRRFQNRLFRKQTSCNHAIFTFTFHPRLMGFSIFFDDEVVREGGKKSSAITQFVIMNPYW